MIPLSKNPPARFPTRSIHEAEAPWWVAKVKPRQEKALAFDLLRDNIEYYLPMYTKVTRRRDNNKPRKSIVCLFPGYISFCPQKGYERTVYTTSRVVTIIEVKNQSLFKRELEQIYHTIDLGIPIEPYQGGDLTPGKLVEVTSGPMRGLQGIIQKIHSGHKLILSVDLLGKAAVSIDAYLVKPV
jgi:transcription antitermination factor NusG